MRGTRASQEQTMNGRDRNSGPRGFVRNWLSFNERRPFRPRLFWKFATAILTMLIACFLLVALREIR
jgi:hypothetical protein